MAERRKEASMREPIRIGGREIKAGERVSFDLPVVNLSTHTPMTMPVHVIHGKKDGPRLFVCAAIHGDEINGIEILRRIIADEPLSTLHGTLIAVPIVNVFGFVSQSRYLPDRRDLNRSFPGSAKGSLAARVAHLFLKEIVANATHGIDLHTGALHRTNYPQIRANLLDPETDRLARAFGAKVVINSSFRKGTLREAAARRKVPVLVYEAGEALRFDSDAIAVGAAGICNVMAALGMIDTRPENVPTVAPLIARSSSWLRAPHSGILRDSVPPGSEIRKGDTLGYVSDPLGANRVAITAKTDGLVIGMSFLPIVYEGDALFHIVRPTGDQIEAEDLDVPTEANEEDLPDPDRTSI
jgi:hypothetical protein